MSRLIDITGQRFDCLTAVRKDASTDRTRWVFLCDCGETKIMTSGPVRKGRVKSCGCKRAGMLPTLRLKHGMAATRVYGVWQSMIGRCERRTVHNFQNYGGRGISVCERWRSFENFLADMGEPLPGQTIERRENNGNYEPGNCIWADRKTQARNTRANLLLTFKGRTQCLTAWCEELNLPYGRIKQRIAAGWPTEKALAA